jgi:hypothetical protein
MTVAVDDDDDDDDVDDVVDSDQTSQKGWMTEMV